MKNLNYKKIAFNWVVNLRDDEFLYVDNFFDKCVAIYMGYPDNKVIILEEILGG